MKRQTVTASLTVSLHMGDDLEGLVHAWYERDILPNLCPSSKPEMKIISIEKAEPPWTVKLDGGLHWLVHNGTITRTRSDRHESMQAIANLLNERDS